MTREELAAKIHWPFLVGIIGIINSLFMVPQLAKIWGAGITSGISLPTLGLLFLIQAFFSGHGFFIRDRLVMVSNGAASFVTFMTICSVLYFR